MSREERLNNPGGIVQSSVKFMGETTSTDPRFKAFVSPTMGIRALARVLVTYFNVRGLNTVEEIINRWAPPVENDTGSYVKDVASRLAVTPGAVIDVMDPAILTILVTAIIHHENGEVIYTEQQIKDGVTAALA